MPEPELSEACAETRAEPAVARHFVAGVTLLLGCGYPALILMGLVHPHNRLSAWEVAFVVAAVAAATVLISPGTLSRFRKLKVSGFEVELEAVRDQQQRQRARIAEIDLLLPLLMPDAQFRHLENLVKRTTTGYRGGGALRDELRRLASSGLIRRRPGRKVASLESDLEFDLADYVKLTRLGALWGQRYIDLKGNNVAEANSAEGRPEMRR